MAHQKNEDQRASKQSSGWSQFTTQKRKMLSDFQIFKDMGENRPTETDKGRHAEALFRGWLEQFLPARYGVTSGYIISQADSIVPRNTLKLRHYDIIIYNKLDSPVLWTEISPDHSMLGSIRAIPVEYVHGVLEVKSTFNSRNISDAFKKLEELVPLLEIDTKNQLYKRYLPANFYMGMIFFDLPEKEQGKLQLLNKLMLVRFPRSFYGGIILSAERLDHRKTGRFFYITANVPFSLVKEKGTTLTSIARNEGGIYSNSIENAPGNHTTCLFGWSETNFSFFAFDLIAVMNGTYNPALPSSLHGLTFS